MKKSLLASLFVLNQVFMSAASAQAVNYNIEYAQNLDKGIQHYEQRNYSQAHKLFLQLLKRSDGGYYNNPSIAKWLFSAMIKEGSSTTALLSLANDIIKKTPQKGGTVEIAQHIIHRINDLKQAQINKAKLDTASDQSDKKEKIQPKPIEEKPIIIKFIEPKTHYRHHYLCQTPLDLEKFKEERWFAEEFPLKVYIDRHNGPSKIVEKAFHKWSQSWSQLQFVFVPHVEMADIKVSWTSYSSSSKPQLHIPPMHHIGHKSEIVLPSNYSQILTGLALHQIGHSLGLPDSPNPGDIMSPEGYANKITQNDLDTLKKIYSLPEKLSQNPCPQQHQPSTPVEKQRWYIKIFNQDDVASAFINNEHGPADLIAYNKGSTNWIDITDKVYSFASNRIRFTLFNKNGGYSWGFSIKYGDQIIWEERSGQKGKIGANYNDKQHESQEVYNKLIIVSPDGQVISQIDQFRQHELQHMY